MTYRLSIWLVALLWPLYSLAQSTGDSEDEAEPIQFYDVEVVIFKNLRVPKSREYVLPVSSPRRDEPVFDIASPERSVEATELGYALLPPSVVRPWAPNPGVVRTEVSRSASGRHPVR